MSAENKQRMKMLRMVDILTHEADEEHPIITPDLISRLNRYGIACDRRSVTRDMALLKEEGFPVVSVFNGHYRGYYMENKKFRISELKILIDAVQAAGFIPEDQTQELIDKLAGLSYEHKNEILKQNLVRFNTRKHRNNAVFQTVHMLENALEKKCRASFCYFHLNEKGERVFRRDGERYLVQPVALVFHEDNYYLICYDSKLRKKVRYRVDRITDARVEPQPVTKECLRQTENIGEEMTSLFKMYDGRLQTVTLEFEDELVEPVFDKFGEDIPITRTGAHTCKVSTVVQVSPTFWGWLFQFIGRMWIINPPGMIREYEKQKQIKNAAE